MEQAGRDLAKIVKETPNTRGDVEDVIDIASNTPKSEKSLALGFEVANTYRQLMKDQIKYALDEIEETCNLIFPDDEDDDDEDDYEDDPVTDPAIPGGKEKVL